MFIKMLVSIPAQTTPDEDPPVKARLYYSVDGMIGIGSHDTLSWDNVKGGDAPMAVPRGASGKAWFTYFDSEGNEGDPSDPQTYTNAADTTGPSRGTGPMSFGKGDSIPDPDPNPFTPVPPPPAAPTTP